MVDPLDGFWNVSMGKVKRFHPSLLLDSRQYILIFLLYICSPE